GVKAGLEPPTGVAVRKAPGRCVSAPLVRHMFDDSELGNMEKQALAWMPQMRILRLIPPAFAVLTLCAAEISPQAYLAHVRYLASPELKGRATGSPELEKAANYIASQFKSFGLKPPD